MFFYVLTPISFSYSAPQIFLNILFIHPHTHMYRVRQKYNIHSSVVATSRAYNKKKRDATRAVINGRVYAYVSKNKDDFHYERITATNKRRARDATVTGSRTE